MISLIGLSFLFAIVRSRAVTGPIDYFARVESKLSASLFSRYFLKHTVVMQARDP
jgi:hypothetical protein